MVQYSESLCGQWVETRAIQKPDNRMSVSWALIQTKLPYFDEWSTQKAQCRRYNHSSIELGPDVNYGTINVPLNYRADVSMSSLVPVGLITQANKISVMVE